MNPENIKRLSKDLHTLAVDAEELLSSAGDDISDKAQEIRDRLAGALETAEDTFDTVNRTVVTGARVADKAIRAKPYQAIGIALAAGFLIALILRREK
jgi:ElaB/YqjD/DUF883 family membrane-anchored ribosome-binding protein